MGPALHFGPEAPKIFQLVEASPKLHLRDPVPDLEAPQSPPLPHPLEYRGGRGLGSRAWITFAHAYRCPESRETALHSLSSLQTAVRNFRFLRAYGNPHRRGAR